MTNWVIQGIGFVGMFLSFISFQRKTKKNILLFQILSSLVYFSHFLLLGALTGSIMNFIGATRNAVFCQRERKWANHPLCLYFFLAIYLVAAVWTWQDYASLLPLVGMIASTISFWMKKPKLIRMIMLISPPCWFAYNLISGSLPGMFTEVFNLLSLFIAIVRFDLLQVAPEHD